jgi:ribosomal protein L7/L12
MRRVFESKLKKGYVLADGILEKLVSKRTKGRLTIYKTKKIGSNKERYVIQEGNNFSHGNNLKQAIEDLQYKISDRDTSEYEKWNLKTKASKAEMIKAYRKITGACAEGVKDFVNSVKVKDEMTVSSVIELTKGRFGNEVFEKFFNK